MHFVFKMMHFVFKMMHFAFKNDGSRLSHWYGIALQVGRAIEDYYFIIILLLFHFDYIHNTSNLSCQQEEW